MAWGEAATLGERFELARAAWPGDRARTYTGFIKALGRWADEALIDLAACTLRSAMAAMAGVHARRCGWEAFAVDGSRVDAPRTAANEKGLGLGGREKTTPQLWLTTLWHMGLGLPWAWRVGRADASEREHLERMLGQLPERALIVADAGYTGYRLLRQITGGGRSFLIRVGSNVELIRELGWAEREDDGTVYLWPDRERRRERPPLTLRLIRVPPAPGRKRPVYLLSDVVDPARLSDEDAAVLYRMRWGVEVFYRSLKQTLERRKLLSRAPRQARLELHGAMLGVWLLGLMGVRAILERGRDPLSLSVAAAVRVVRRAMRQPRQVLRDLWRRLGEAVKDDYTRRRPRRSRRCPRKKTQKPPGRPRLRKATRAQRRAATRLAAGAETQACQG